MRETMQTMPRGVVMPVIQEVIMQQAGFHEIAQIPVPVETCVQCEHDRDGGDIHAVLVGGGDAVLDESFLRLHAGGADDAAAKLEHHRTRLTEQPAPAVIPHSTHKDAVDAFIVHIASGGWSDDGARIVVGRHWLWPHAGFVVVLVHHNAGMQIYHTENDDASIGRIMLASS